MDEEWDAENFESHTLGVKSLTVSDKWAGEDEDDDVKDNWEDEEEEKKDEEKQEEIRAIQVKKKKTLAEKIEEKERLAREEQARKIAAREAMKKLTPQEKQVEKLRQQKLQEEADLQVTKETFGVSEGEPSISIDNLDPTTQEDFNQLHEALSKKLQNCTNSTHFVPFLENLFRKLCVTLSSTDIKKLKTTIDNLYLEKTKAEKSEKSKKTKGKGKARLMMDYDDDFRGADYDYDDDFL